MTSQPNNSSKNYITEKIPFAAYLITLGKAELIGVQPVANSNNIGLILSKTPSNEDMTKYFMGNGRVPARRFTEILHDLKGVIYEARRLQH